MINSVMLAPENKLKANDTEISMSGVVKVAHV